ncbi:rhomboid family intramembrane serine protease [Aliiruegeria sabulilitoris]|uniref:rhomboid family intramembrane serine protease n=1 Tax=Aliiruegeria sabulilitoris TaxID=1510458 RepID=UPI00082B698F|nr:rhomboid family intramembrane serine protease [Aliiruegeria sabulilitoris]NDR55932.1 rhomboid family intramembrane serine protease [Pseudoruegeria sp. M32A2M]
MQAEPHDSPFNSIPPVVVALVAVLFGIEVLFYLSKSGLIAGTRGGEDWRIFAIQDYAFSGEIFKWMIETHRWPIEHVKRFMTYLFVHGSFTHMVMVCVFVLALGKMVGETFRQWTVLVIFLASGIVGALAYGLLLSTTQPLFGGYPGAYGLIGAFTFILWVGYGRTGENQLQAFRLIGFLMGIQLLFGLIFGANKDWVAELAGFFTGFILSVVLQPGGWTALVQTMRQR